MQFRTKLVAFAVCLAFGAATCAMVSLVLARGIDRGMQSVTQAEDLLTLYLNMETSISDMLRLQVTASVAGSDIARARLAGTKAAVRRDIDLIRSIVDDDPEFRGEEVLVKLRRLDQITLILDDVENLFLEPLDQPEIGRVDRLARPLAEVFAVLDERLAPQVDLAIADEAAKVLITRAEIAELTRRSVRFGTAAGLLTLLAAAGGLYLLLTSFMRPFGALLQGASRLAEGDLAHRIARPGTDEFGRLGRDFNVMAEQLERSDRALRAEEEELQRRVAERTAELEEANARLADQDATRRRFLADISHELRTPLTVMRGEAEVALRMEYDAMSPPAREALGSVVEQSEHMSRLVNDLLFVARREAGEVPLNLSHLDLGAVLRQAVSDASMLSTEAVVVLKGAQDALDTQIEADPSRLHQLLMVLLDNALRYSPGGSEVSVSALRAGQAIHVSVHDEGIGIPSEELPNIFDRFVRGSNAMPGGSGLGLPVAKAIAEAHGGTLEIESEEGAGTTVVLTLPLSQKGGDA